MKLVDGFTLTASFYIMLGLTDFGYASGDRELSSGITNLLFGHVLSCFEIMREAF